MPDCLALRSQHGPARFVESPCFRDAEEVRIVGCPGNARLIAAVYESWLSGRTGDHRVLLGSPSICLERQRLSEPQFVLQRLWQPGSLALQRGWWHEMGSVDYTHYMMAAALQESGCVDEKVRRTFRCHPAWPAVAFIPTADLDASIKLVCEISDPRWYNHPEHPGRPSRLFSFLGLNIGAFELLRGGKVGCKRNAALVLCWRMN